MKQNHTFFKAGIILFLVVCVLCAVILGFVLFSSNQQNQGVSNNSISSSQSLISISQDKGVNSSSNQSVSLSQSFSTTVESQNNFSSLISQGVSSSDLSSNPALQQPDTIQNQTNNSREVPVGGTDADFDIRIPESNQITLNNGFTARFSRSQFLESTQSWVSNLIISDALLSSSTYTSVIDASGNEFNIGPGVDYINVLNGRWVIAIRISYSEYVLYSCSLNCLERSLIIPFTDRKIVNVEYDQNTKEPILYTIPTFDSLAIPQAEIVPLKLLLQAEI